MCLILHNAELNVSGNNPPYGPTPTIHTSSHTPSHTHQETIANLSSKVENLKMQMATLRRSLSQHNDDDDGEKRSIMFTRLDSERNKRTLKAALEDDMISPTTYDKVWVTACSL